MLGDAPPGDLGLLQTRGGRYAKDGRKPVGVKAQTADGHEHDISLLTQEELRTTVTRSGASLSRRQRMAAARREVNT